jgi:ubiquinone/menaquinone biosynthesis C-methylase UbiE
MTADSEISAAYDRWAASYDIDNNATRDLDAIVLREAGPNVAGRDVLELGCGTGKNTAWLVERARSVTAIDFSAGMLDVARRRVESERVRFDRADIRNAWPIEAASVDVVLLNLVLEHVADVAHVFREAARVLRSDGELYVCELHPYRQLRGGQAHFTDSARGETVYVPAFVHTISEFVNASVDAGLEVLRLGEWCDRHRSPGVACQQDSEGACVPRLITMSFSVRRPSQ